MVIYIFSFFHSDFLQQNLFGRFLIEDGKLAGDNRMSDYFSNFFWRDFVFRTDEFLFGTNDSIDKSLGGSSIIISVYKYGFLWVCFTVIICIYLL